MTETLLLRMDTPPTDPGSGPGSGHAGLTGSLGSQTLQLPSAELAGFYVEKLEWTPPPEKKRT